MIATRNALALATRHNAPFSVRDIANTFQLRPLSLRSLVAGISRQTLTLWVSFVQPSTIDPTFRTAHTLEDLQKIIQRASGPSPDFLKGLSASLTRAGGRLILSKKSFRIVGIHGSVESLFTIPRVAATDLNSFIALISSLSASPGGVHPNDETSDVPNSLQGLGMIFEGIALVAAGFYMEVGSAGLLTPPALITIGAGFGLAGAGAGMLGWGIGGLIDPPQATPQKPTSSTGGGGEGGEDELHFPDEGFGSPPDDIARAIAAGDDVGDFGVDDPGEIPSTPPIGGDVPDVPV